LSNRFTGFSPQQYVESYQKLPWEMLAGMAEMYNKKLEEEDQYKAVIGKGLASINAINKDSHLQKRQELVNGYNTELAKLDAEAANDPIAALPKYKQFVYKLQQDLTSGEAATLNATYSDFQKDKENLMKEKDIDSNEATRILNRSIEQTPDFEYDANKGATSLYNSFGYVKDPGIAKKLLEYRDAMTPEEWDNVGVKTTTDSAGNITGYYDTHDKGKRLSSEEITRRLTGLLQTDEQAMRYLKYRADLDTPYSPDENKAYTMNGQSYRYREDAQNDYLNSYINNVAEAVGNATPINVHGGGNNKYSESSGYNQSLKDNTPNQPVQLLDTGFDDSATALTEKIKEINSAEGYYNSDGSLAESIKINKVVAPKTRYETDEQYKNRIKNIKNGIETVKNNNYNKHKKLIQEIITKIPTLSGHTDKEILSAYKQLLEKSTDKKAFVGVDLGGLNNEAVTKDILQSLPSRTIKVTGDKNNGSTLDDAVKALNISTDGFIKALESKSGYVYGLKPLSPNNPGSYIVSIKDGSGIQREVTISGTKNQQSYFTGYNRLMENALKGEMGISNTVLDPVSGKNVISVTDIRSDQNGFGSYGTIIYPTATVSETNEVLKKYNNNIEDAIKDGYTFVKDNTGKMVIVIKELVQDITGDPNATITPEQYSIYLANAWYNSPYNNKYRSK